MRRTLLAGMVFGLLLGSSSVLFASEADELREKATAIRKEALAQAKRGAKDEAKELEREAARMLEMAEQFERKVKGQGDKTNHPEGRELKERLQDLLAKERKLRETKASKAELSETREQIAAVERQLHGEGGRGPKGGGLPAEVRAQAEHLEAATRRIHHLRVAAENLKLAEAHDLAEKLMEQAAHMERDVQEAKKQLAMAVQKTHGSDHGPEVLGRLLSEVERLRAEVRELRQRVDKENR